MGTQNGDRLLFLGSLLADGDTVWVWVGLDRTGMGATEGDRAES